MTQQKTLNPCCYNNGEGNYGKSERIKLLFYNVYIYYKVNVPTQSSFFLQAEVFEPADNFLFITSNCLLS